MSDHRRLSCEPHDHSIEVVGDLADRLVGEDLGIRVRLLDGFRIIRPPRGERGVSGLLEYGGPADPAVGEKPQSVDKDNWRSPRCVCTLDLLGLSTSRCVPFSHGRGHGTSFRET